MSFLKFRVTMTLDTTFYRIIKVSSKFWCKTEILVKQMLRNLTSISRKVQAKISILSLSSIKKIKRSKYKVQLKVEIKHLINIRTKYQLILTTFNKKINLKIVKRLRSNKLIKSRFLNFQKKANLYNPLNIYSLKLLKLSR